MEVVEADATTIQSSVDDQEIQNKKELTDDHRAYREVLTWTTTQ